MKNDCTKWKDQLLEAALTGTAAGDLEEHVLKCATCAEELEALRARDKGRKRRRNAVRGCWPQRRPRAKRSAGGRGEDGVWPERRRPWRR